MRAQRGRNSSSNGGVCGGGLNGGDDVVAVVVVAVVVVMGLYKVCARGRYGRRDVDVPAFTASCFTVTNAEFLPFVLEHGYAERRWCAAGGAARGGGGAASLNACACAHSGGSHPRATTRDGGGSGTARLRTRPSGYVGTCAVATHACDPVCHGVLVCVCVCQVTTSHPSMAAFKSGTASYPLQVADCARGGRGC